MTAPGATTMNGVRAQARPVGEGTPAYWQHADAQFAIEVQGRELRVALFESVHQLAALREPWTELAGQTASQSGFLTWEWMHAWSRSFVRGGRRLFVLALMDGSRLIGLAPWYVQPVRVGFVRTRQIGFLGTPEAGSDYLDVVAVRSKESLVAEALVSVLFGPLSSQWDTLALHEIPAESAFLSRFISELRGRGKHYIVQEGSYCPGVRLPDSYETYLGQFSAHGRQGFRRKMRALRSSGTVEHVVLRGEADVRCGLATFRALYEKRWGQSRTADDLFGALDGYLPYARAAWDVELSLLQIDGRAVAGLVHLTRGRTMYQYLMAVDRSFNRSLSIGNLICAMNIERAIQEGFAEYDFLKSEEDYKRQFMTHGRRALNLMLHNRSARAIAAWGIEAARHCGKILFR